MLEPIATVPSNSIAAAVNTAQHHWSLPSATTAPPIVRHSTATNRVSALVHEPRFQRWELQFSMR
jgi:hypothetical protein